MYNPKDILGSPEDYPPEVRPLLNATLGYEVGLAASFAGCLVNIAITEGMKVEVSCGDSVVAEVNDPKQMLGFYRGLWEGEQRSVDEWG